MATSVSVEKVLKALDAPEGSRLRRVEHVVAVLAALKVCHGLWKLGASGIKKKVVGAFLSTARVVPGLKDAVQGEEDEMMAKLEKEFLGIVPDPKAHTSIPESGTGADDIIAECTTLRAKETKYSSAKSHAGIYYAGEELARVQKAIVSMYLSSNLLYPGVFQSARKFEAEVVAMVADMVHGSCGSFASGGSEAVFLAVKAHREWAAAKKGITEPEVVACTTAHPCLDKACYLLRVKLVKVQPNPDTQQMDVAAVKAALTPNTMFVYASAPTFPHGVVDPIEEVAEVTRGAGIGLHVDNCLGGFLMSHLTQIGEFTRKWDFQVKGVTTMSVDVHKFGSCPKGASIVVYHSPEMRRFQYYSMVEWPGGLYATPTVQGSRPGAAVAGAWASIVHIGRSGYQDRARKFAAAMKKIVKEVSSMPGLRVIGHPDACAVSFTSDTYNIYTLAAKAQEKGGWSITGLQRPAAVHILMGDRTLTVLDDMLKDIREAAEELAAKPDTPATGTLAAMYGNNEMLPAEEMEASLFKYLDLCYKVKPATEGDDGAK